MSDKRKVSTDALETLGTIIDAHEKRDAIHLAVEPIKAAEKLYPGQDVGIVNGKAVVCDKPLGIVDPFLKNLVYEGQYFWLVVYPRKITSSRHVWSHPDFEEETNNSAAESKNWITDFADRYGFSYNEIIQHARNYLRNSEYYIGGAEMEGEFWIHYQIVTGEKVSKDQQGNFFGCSC